MKRLFAFILSICVLLSIAACGNKDNNNATNATSSSNATNAAAEKVTLKIFAPYSDEDTKIPFDYAKQALAEEMPNVTLELEVQPQDDGTKLKTYAATGMLPDIFDTDATLINTLIKSEQILVLDEYFTKFNVLDQFNDTAKQVQLQHPDGHYYAIPRNGCDVAAIYYNAELFEQNNVKVPVNFEELMEAVNTFKGKGILPLSIFAKEKWPGVQLFDMIVTREEPLGIMKLDTPEASITDEPFKKAVDKLYTLAKAGAFGNGAINTSYDQAAELFYGGKAAMFINGGWEVPDLDKRSGGKADILYYPFADKGKEEACKWNMSGGGSIGGFAVSAASENKDIAAEACIKFTLKYDEGRVLKRAQVSSPLKETPTPEQELSAVHKRFMEDSLNFQTMSGFDWNMTNVELSSKLDDAVQYLITGGYEPEKFIQDMEKAIEEAKK